MKCTIPEMAGCSSSTSQQKLALRQQAGPGAQQLPEMRKLSTYLSNVIKPQIMTYKLKSIMYFGCLLAAIALYEVTAPEKEEIETAAQTDYSELDVNTISDSETAQIEFIQ